jgi:N-acetylglucosamine-6-sulfatase
MLVVALAVVAVIALGASCGSGRSRHKSAAASTTTSSGPASTGTGQTPLSPARAAHPNIVFVLTDDLSLDLLAYMPQVQALETRGLTFDDYFVSDSLCCPSRASIFTGDFPHDTGVFNNVGPQGGFNGFYARHEEDRSFNVALQRAGYRAALMGKYLNGYLGANRSATPPTYVPPGWNQWDVAGFGYPEFDYAMNENGRIRRFGHLPRDYLTDVITRKGIRFIDAAAHAHEPFFLELATFAPHRPYTPAPRDRHDFPGLGAPRPPDFDELPSDPPQWLAGHPPLNRHKLHEINRAFRRRAQSVQAIDAMIRAVELTLARRGLTRDTYFVFSSDNGLHTGEYRLTPGKLTAFDTDIHVPLVVVGPGVPIDRQTHAIAQNIDLADTFAAIADAPIPDDDGHSLLPLLRGERATDWRDAALIEHHGPASDPSDPDRQNRASGNPTTYEAMRTDHYLYVEYSDGEREFYALRPDPYELHNIAGQLAPDRLAALHADLARLEFCHGKVECWAAAHVAGLPAAKR